MESRARYIPGSEEAHRALIRNSRISHRIVGMRPYGSRIAFVEALHRPRPAKSAKDGLCLRPSKDHLRGSRRRLHATRSVASRPRSYSSFFEIPGFSAKEAVQRIQLGFCPESKGLEVALRDKRRTGRSLGGEPRRDRCGWCNGGRGFIALQKCNCSVSFRMASRRGR
jgi:hypothetical protein